ncbi:PEP-CTERM sorting domain-containing protein [Roseateles sp. So40a]|uniref:PEP-CTERM sorting domain-containing protein n=1 Tax=Roseateles sp. So40a TaxID=3400226 RepID=UPI003A8B32BA
MIKQATAVVLSLGLAQTAAMAAVDATLDGYYMTSLKTVGCPAPAADCSGYTRDLGLLFRTFNQPFSFENGVTPGQPSFSTQTSSMIDPASGRRYDNLSATQHYANWVTTDPTAAQVPPLFAPTANPLDVAGAVSTVTTSAFRDRTVSVWSDSGQVFQSNEIWTLQSTQRWQAADGSTFERLMTLSASASFAGTVANYDDAQSLDYFVSQLARSTCVMCVRFNLGDTYVASNGAVSSTRFTGFAHVTSVTQSVAAVPEPSTYALMLAGVGVIGVMARRKRAIRS